ncbi:rod shape-determining protein RodA [bacterium]|nr:rod shape-determining protein RodA [bacterium]
MKSHRIGDPLVLVTILVIFLIGIFVLYTTSPIGSSFSNWVDSLLARQLLFGLGGVFVIVCFQFVDLQITKTFLVQLASILVTIGLLVGLFLLGPLVNETHRWYKFGSFLLQPSEFAKIILALWSAYWITSDNIKVKAKVFLGGGGLLVVLVLILLQPDFGATIISGLIVSTIFILWLIKYEVGRGLILWAVSSIGIVLLSFFSSPWLLLLLGIPFVLLLRSNWKIGLAAVVLFGIVAVSTLGIRILWNTGAIPDYVKFRVESFAGTQEESFQIRQSKIAVGSGGLWGKGVSQGTQTRLKFLPEYTTDFIFSAFVEERGFMGMLLLCALYLLLFGRLIVLALKVKDEYSRLVIIGLTVKLWFETFVNIGMNMGVLPTKGVALPFMSYGGSSLVANAVIIGIILSLYRYEAKRDTISPSFGLA